MRMRNNALTGIIEQLLQLVPHAGVISSLLVITLLIVTNKMDILPYALCLLIPVVVISLLFIYKRASFINNGNNLLSFTWINLKQITLIKLFVIIFSITIVYILIVGNRDVILLLLVITLYTIAIIQVFLKKTNCKVIALQLALASLIHVLTKQFCNYYFYQGGDSIAHNLMSDVIIEHGYVVSDLFGEYTNFCLMHVSIAISSIISALPSYPAHWIFISVPLVFISIFIYLIARSLTKSDRIAALSVFFYFMTPIVLRYTESSPPRILSSVAFVIIVYLFLKYNEQTKNWGAIICAAIMSLYMVMSHHAQLILLFGVMLFIVVIYHIYFRRFSNVQKIILTLFYSIPILYYLFTFLGKLIGILDTNFFGTLESTSIIETSTVKSDYFGLSNFLSISVAILMVIVILLGIYYLLLPQNKKHPAVILWPLSLISFPLFLPDVSSAFSAISSMEQIGRLQIVLVPIFAVLMAIGLIVLGYLFTKGFKKSRVGIICMIVFCVLIVIASPILSQSRDSSFFDGTDMSARNIAFTNSEIASFDFFENTTISRSNIYSDYSTTRYFTSNEGMQYIGKNIYNFPRGNLELFRGGNVAFNPNSYIIFRKDVYMTKGLTITLYGGNNVGFDTESIKYNNEEYNNYLRNTYQLNTIYSNTGLELKSI